jgi:hypothetical protein
LNSKSINGLIKSNLFRKPGGLGKILGMPSKNSLGPFLKSTKSLSQITFPRKIPR